MSVSLVLAPQNMIAPIDHGRLMHHASRRAWWLSAGFAAAIVAAGALVHVDGAVVAGGEVAVADKVKKIAHPTGGVVSQIFVQEGDHVVANQPLIRLDDRTPLLSNALLDKSVEQLEARRARLVAERDALPAIAFPVSLTGSTAPAAQQAIAEERRQFALARGGAGNVRGQLSERIRQLESQLGGLAAQSRSLSEQRRLLQPELEGMQQLWEKRLVPLARLNGLQRSSIELVSANAAISAQQAAARSQIAELRQKMSEVSGSDRTRAGTELAEVEAQLAEQRMRAASSQDVVDRSVIRATKAGIVSKLLVGTVGGVLPATETVAEIVPDGSDLMVAARISPTDIDRVAAGGKATLRFSAFNAQTTPVIDGIVQRVAPDVSVDPRTGGTYYNAVIAVPRDQARRLGQATLVSGMPVEVMVRTGGRSLLSYIFKPLRDQFERAFRQE